MRKHRGRSSRKAPTTKWKPPEGYKLHFLRMALLVGNAKITIMKPQEVEALGDVNWLGVAIGRLGGFAEAAKAIGVKRQTIYEWVANGLENASFGKVAELAKVAQLPLDVLAEQRQPYSPKISDGLQRVR